MRRRKTSSVQSHRDLRPGHAYGGSTGTWEISSIPLDAEIRVAATETRGLRESRTCAQEPDGNTNTDAREVPLSEGNEATRDDRREVGGARSTDEAGELTP